MRSTKANKVPAQNGHVDCFCLIQKQSMQFFTLPILQTFWQDMLRICVALESLDIFVPRRRLHFKFCAANVCSNFPTHPHQGGETGMLHVEFITGDWHCSPSVANVYVHNPTLTPLPIAFALKNKGLLERVLHELIDGLNIYSQYYPRSLQFF